MYKALAISTILLISCLSGYFYLYSSDIKKDEPSYNILLVGDVGTADQNQRIVAEKMNEIGAQHQSKFVLSLGDNFYPNGLSGADDPLWDTAYNDLYPKMSYLKDLPWLGTIGNHDYRGLGLFTEFEYKENNWRIDDFFWSHTDKIGDMSVAYIHIDTSFLAYGPEGSEVNMRNYFVELGWSKDEDVLVLIEEQLIEFQNYDWIIVMGHHHIGYACPDQYHTSKIYTLLQKYRVDAYLCGHSHTLSFALKDDMGLVVSGAGGHFRRNECAPANPYWAVGNIFGFMDLQIYEDRLEVEAHYIRFDWEKTPDAQWVDFKLPTIYRRTNK